MSSDQNPQSVVVWLYGPVGPAIAALCNAVACRLRECLKNVYVLEEDQVKDVLGSGRDDAESKLELVRRMSYTASVLAENAITVLVAATNSLHMAEPVRHNRNQVTVEVLLTLADSEYGARQDGKGSRTSFADGSGRAVVANHPPALALQVGSAGDGQATAENVDKILSLLAEARQCAEGDHFLSMSEAGGSKESPRTIAVDMDGLIANYDGWQGRQVIGSPRQDVLQALHELKKEGWKIVVHTTRCEGDIRGYLETHRIPFDEINSNSDKPTLGPKPHANVYWDDRALRYSGNAKNDLKYIRMFRTWSGRR